MRTDQYIGLPETAHDFLRENEAGGQFCPTCNQALPRVLQEIDSFSGMFDQDYPLHRHTLNDGRTADEFLQSSPWSSGPMFFIGLRVSDGTEFVWTEDEIASYV